MLGSGRAEGPWMSRGEQDDVYARKREQARVRRVRGRDTRFDPRPPDDSDWSVTDGSGLARVPGPSAVGEVLGQLVRRSGWSERLESVAVHDRWRQIVGPELATRCEPVRLAGTTLLIRAESQAWAAQLRYMLPQLAAHANAVLGEGMVARINLTVGPLGDAHGPPMGGESGGVGSPRRGERGGRGGVGGPPMGGEPE